MDEMERWGLKYSYLFAHLIQFSMECVGTAPGAQEQLMNNLRFCTSRSEIDSYVQPEMLLNHTCSLEEIRQIM